MKDNDNVVPALIIGGSIIIAACILSYFLLDISGSIWSLG